MARLRDKYKKEIAPALAKEFDIKNPMAVPKIEKVVVNMGLGEASANVTKAVVSLDRSPRLIPGVARIAARNYSAYFQPHLR